MRAETIETDVLIIGGGAAGCSAALRADELGAKVVMVVKGKMGRSGATPLASALAAPPPLLLPLPLLKRLTRLYAAIAEKIRLPIFGRYRKVMWRMLAPHHWLVDQDYFVNFGLWVLESFFPSLERKGLYLLRGEDGKPVVPNSGNIYYVLHSHGMTGYLFGEAKRKEVLDTPVEVFEEATAYHLLRGANGEVAGACVLDGQTGRHYAIRAKATILATGHTNWLATRSTGTREMAANGLAMAARAGAELQNLEIQWYHGSDMASPASWMRLHHYPNPLTGTDRRAVMVNRDGDEYMRIENYDIGMPYTIQLKKLYEQVRAGKADWDGGSFADFSRVPRELLEKYQYHWEFYEKLGMDMSRDRLEAGITWHMSAGGVRADIKTMATGVPGLFIAGGIGAHMLGSLSFATYDGQIAGSSAVAYAKAHGLAPVDAREVEEQEDRLGALLASAGTADEGAISPIEAKRRIREIVWNGMMYRKDPQGLLRALAELSAARDEILPRIRLRHASSRYNSDLVEALDAADMIDVCEMAAQASLLREESRGPHFREDHPYTDNENWLKWIVLARRNGRIEHRYEPVRQKYVHPGKRQIDYFADPYA